MRVLFLFLSLPALCIGVIMTLDAGNSTKNVGKYASIALSGSLLPRVVYWDEITKDMKSIACDDPYCTSWSSGFLANALPFGGHFDLVIPPVTVGGGDPLVSAYQDNVATQYLTVVTCPNMPCSFSSGFGNNNLDLFGGTFNSLAVGPTGFPQVSYYHEGDLQVKLWSCSDFKCTNILNSTIVVLDDAGGEGGHTSMQLNPVTNFPVIAYRSSLTLKLCFCTDIRCNSTTRRYVTPETTGSSGLWNSLQLDVNREAVVAHSRGGSLGLVHCLDSMCDTWSTATLDTAPSSFASLQLREGRKIPLVAYYRTTSQQMWLASCLQSLCNSGVTLRSVAPVGEGTRPSMVLQPGVDVALIAFHNQATRSLQLAVVQPEQTLQPTVVGPQTIQGDLVIVDPTDLTQAQVAVNGSLTLALSSVITVSSSSNITVAGAVMIAGQLVIQLSAKQPQQLLTVLQAGTIVGQFDAVNVSYAAGALLSCETSRATVSSALGVLTASISVDSSGCPQQTLGGGAIGGIAAGAVALAAGAVCLGVWLHRTRVRERTDKMNAELRKKDIDDQYDRCRTMDVEDK